ncbi:glutamine--fructose-6-phosphate transaminase (isomerizing) [Actinomadura kijaniata]
MCGIVAYVGSQDAVPIVLEGLQRLEYRGYDSAGLAVLGRGGALKVRKAKGRVRECAEGLPARFKGPVGIGHTRWATHGEPSDANAHPHVSGTVAVVHNGVIENAEELRAKLEAQGVEFSSETDSEVLAHLIATSGAGDLAEAVRSSLTQVVGTYGIAVIDAARPGECVVARNGSPVVLGLGDREMYAASDVAALVGHTRQVVHLDDGELAVLTASGYRTFTLEATATVKQPSQLEGEAQAYEMGGHAHFMAKEISEQPEVVRRALRGRLDGRFHTAHLGGLNLEAREARAIRRVKIIGCGTAYYSGQVGAQLIEELARIPADAEPASEFRYRNPVVEPDTLYVAVSQSGETYDTLAAVQELRRKGGRVLGLVNVVGSAIARACDGGIYLHAGPEVSVASTKTFTATGVAFALLALYLGRIRDLSPAEGARVAAGLRALPEQIEQVLAQQEHIARVARELAEHRAAFFIGRVRGFPVAREGAQKLKEISYLHAEAYPASELKHGPLALIDPGLPTVAVLPDDELRDKNLTTLGEIAARRGRTIVVAHSPVPGVPPQDVILVPRNEPELDPILMTVPLQLLAYHAALTLGHDIDRPRNLAKSVTVE